jgi:DNA-directed RNA polymerase specialized sigma24 family protein
MTSLERALSQALPPTRRQWLAWVRREPVLVGMSYEQLRTELTPGHSSSARADVLLAALWRLTRHDREAGRLLLACLLPGVRAIAGRYRCSLGHEEAFAVAVAALWERIARFDPPTSHVAYRLLWLAGRRVHRAAESQRDTVARYQPLTSDETLVDVMPEVSAKVTLGEAVSAGVVTRRDAWLVWATYGAGLTVAEAAALLGLHYEQAKKRRQRADAALGAWLGGDGTASE